MPLVLEAYGDAVADERPEILAQHVVELAFPLAPQEGDDLVPAGHELAPVTPRRIDGVRARHPLGVARVPGRLGHEHLLARPGLVERRQRQAGSR